MNNIFFAVQFLFVYPENCIKMAITFLYSYIFPFISQHFFPFFCRYLCFSQTYSLSFDLDQSFFVRQLYTGKINALVRFLVRPRFLLLSYFRCDSPTRMRFHIYKKKATFPTSKLSLIR